ncbi:MAG: hypothetical protein AAFV54_01345 [Pseudomonadota bacterium]
MSNSPPEDTIRDGKLKASIWRNESEKGPFFTTRLVRTYKDEDGKLHDTNSFHAQDLLGVSELARQAHHRVSDLRREEFKERRQQEQPQERGRGFRR